MRKYVCSDLHGRYRLWGKIKEKLGSNDWLFMLGDAADRGEDGWKILKEVLTDPRVVYIRGNHDQMLLDAWKTEWADSMIWFYNGGFATFDAIMADEKAELYLRELDKTVQFYTFHENGREVVLTHAGFTPSYEATDVLWDREHISDDWPQERNEYIIHGHTPCIHLYKYGAVEAEYDPDYTIAKYADGHKICIDAGPSSNRIALLDLQTLEHIVLVDN